MEVGARIALHEGEHLSANLEECHDARDLVRNPEVGRSNPISQKSILGDTVGACLSPVYSLIISLFRIAWSAFSLTKAPIKL